MNRTMIGLIERGQTNPSIGALHRLAVALDVDLSVLTVFSPKKVVLLCDTCTVRDQLRRIHQVLHDEP